MSNIIKIKRSQTTGVLPESLEDGEIFINQKDRVIAYKDDVGVIRTLDLKIKITSGTAAPTGGDDGDIYLQYTQ